MILVPAAIGPTKRPLPVDGCIAITGTNGFVGRALRARIVANGGTVRAIQRRTDISVAGHTAYLVDDLLTADVDRLFDGCTAVIHCAARVHVTARESAREAAAAYDAMNHHLPVRLATAARSAGVGRFIQLSSVAAIRSHSAPGETIDDDSTPAPHSPYGQSKLAADMALSALSDTQMPIIALRPPAIYGPGVGAFFALLMKAARLGLPLPVGRINNRRSFIFLDNMVDAILAALASHLPGTYIVTDSDPLSTAALYRQLLLHYGHGDRTWPWPRPLVEAAALVALRDRAASFIGDAAYDGHRFATDTGWQPAVAMAMALQQTVAGEKR